MLKIDKFFLNNVRCFKGEKEFNIRPLTFLIGENSTGKSTILGCINALGRYIVEQESALNFNLDPFEMGSFANIVRRTNPKNTEFELGFGFHSGKTASEYELRYTLSEQPNSATPIIKQVRLIYADGEIIFIADNSDDNEDPPKIEIEQRGAQKIFKVLLARDAWRLLTYYSVMRYIDYDMTHHFRRGRYSQAKETSRNSEAEQLYQFIKDKKLDRFFGFPFYFYSFAPIRSEPQRSYDPLLDAETSYGSEIPVLLRNLYIRDKEKWDKLKDKLVEFGKSSSLFTDIRIRTFGGKDLSNPFQLEFNKGVRRGDNLVDIGYGVSQILPIVTRLFMTEEHRGRSNRMARFSSHQFLMQQPEVHLHPKAQAALTSLLVERATSGKYCFIIETHSDFMVNRACIEIMRGNIKPEDVSLIYLEEKKGDIEVYNFCFNKEADFTEEPPLSYRDFFMRETRQLLGWDD